jgi:hypothetical protein
MTSIESNAGKLLLLAVMVLLTPALTSAQAAKWQKAMALSVLTGVVTRFMCIRAKFANPGAGICWSIFRAAALVGQLPPAIQSSAFTGQSEAV